MLIISKTSDYYDGVFSIPDKTLVYTRKEEEVHNQRLFNPSRMRLWQHSNNIKQYKHTFPLYTHYEHFDDKNPRHSHDWKIALLGFCGKTYVIAKVYKHGSTTPIYIYDKDKIINMFSSKDRHSYSSSRRKEEIVNLYEQWHERLNYEMFRELNCPVFIFEQTSHVSNYQLIKNPILKPMNFATVFDAGQAAQEIYMFMDTQLRPREEITEVSDASKIASRGFDEKSFRNRGKKPKRRKHRNS